MIGGKPHRSDDRAPQSAASRDRKGAPGGSVRGAALARLGRARSTRRPPPGPPRPARSWPERRSRGPQPAAVRAPPRVPRLACPSAAWRPPPARHGAGPVRTPPPSRARTRAVRHSRVPVLVPQAEAVIEIEPHLVAGRVVQHAQGVFTDTPRACFIACLGRVTPARLPKHGRVLGVFNFRLYLLVWLQ